MLWSVALTLALDVERDVTAAAGPAPPPPCADDPGYFQRGQQFGQQIDWTSCTNWTGYTCATDAAQWGITDEADVAYLVRSCPVSCKDGPCNPDRLAWDDDQYDGLSSYSYGRDYSWDDTGVENNGECPCPSEWRGDGECDRLCNTAACNWDVHDCFHDDDGCCELAMRERPIAPLDACWRACSSTRACTRPATTQSPSARARSLTTAHTAPSLHRVALTLQTTTRREPITGGT